MFLSAHADMIAKFGTTPTIDLFHYDPNTAPEPEPEPEPELKVLLPPQNRTELFNALNEYFDGDSTGPRQTPRKWKRKETSIHGMSRMSLKFNELFTNNPASTATSALGMSPVQPRSIVCSREPLPLLRPLFRMEAIQRRELQWYV